MLWYNKSLKNIARQLRNNMTDHERILWSKIKGKQLKEKQFYRQKIIGNYIVDFYCPKANLVIEIDGSQHYGDEEKKKDEIRDKYLNDLGLKVMRFSNFEIRSNLNGVLKRIYDYL